MTSPSENPNAAAAPKPKTFVISMRCGRLANRLTIFAHFIGLAEEHGHRVINFTFHSYADLFENTRRDIYCRYPVARRRSWMDIVPGVAPLLRKSRLCYRMVRAAAVFNSRVPILGSSAVTLFEQVGAGPIFLESPDVQGKIRDARLVFIYGWPFRAPECVRRHADKIRAYFRPIDSFERASSEAVSRIRWRAEIVVGVHVRHGDYRTFMGGRYFYETGRYAAWMREFAGHFPGRKVGFMVCSDEPRSAGEFPGLHVEWAPGSPVGDLVALSKCDYIMGPESTFSQWASFYGNAPLLVLQRPDTVVAPAGFRVWYFDH